MRYGRKHVGSVGTSCHEIKVLDGDLGLSGVSAEARSDFKALVAEC
ncbi:MAG TPA: hypothetical protein V6C81_00010 [Planktothrix sp.]|jgi:hypothetical protein